MMSQDEKLERELLRAFRRHSAGLSQEGLFDLLDPDSRKKVVSDAALRENEKIVLIGFEDQGEGRLLITTRRLILMKGEACRSIDAADIKNVSVDLPLEMALGRKDKKNWRALVLESKMGDKESFILKADAQFWGFLSAAKWLVNHGPRSSDR